MCGPYWSQWDSSDLDSWQGKDLVEHDEDEDIDVDHEEKDEEEEDEGCPKCGGGGCNYCLMLEW